MAEAAEAADPGPDNARGRPGAYPQSVIVVIGSPIGRLGDGAITAAGMASRVALAAALGGRDVQLVGRTGDDPIADRLIVDLARGGVGHVALLRDPARATPIETPRADDEPADEEAATLAVDVVPEHDTADDVRAGERRDSHQADGPALEGADVDLGLRYLTDFSVVVLAEPVDPVIVTVVADAALWGEARMILIVRAGEVAPDGLPADVVVFEAPPSDPDGAFASLVGSFAAALDAGTEPGDAFRASIATDGWTGTEDG